MFLLCFKLNMITKFRKGKNKTLVIKNCKMYSYFSKVTESYGEINKDSLSPEQQEFLANIQPRENLFENLERLKDESVLMVGG